MEVLDALQIIEHSIYFDRTKATNTTTTMSSYSTGISPHFGDGPMIEGGRCPFIKFWYNCRSDVAIDSGLNNYTLQLHPDDFRADRGTQHILGIIQRESHYYAANLWDHHFQRNLKIHKSMFTKPINVLLFGNSYLRQIMEAMLCLLHSTPEFKDTVSSIESNVRKCNESLPLTHDMRDQVCPSWDLQGVIIWKNILNLTQQYPMDFGHDPNDTNFKSYWKRELDDHNVCWCDHDVVHFRLSDGSNITYSFQNTQQNKTMRKTVDEMKARGFADNDTDFDVILFNLGNTPSYELESELKEDLQTLGHLKKPVILIEHIWNDIDLVRIDELRRQFPNLLAVSEKRRQSAGGMPQSAVPMIRGHLCQPGTAAHHALSALHLVNLLLDLDVNVSE